MNPLSLDRLRSAVQEDAAFRVITHLRPAGGDGDKLFPPTYAADGARTLYVFEERRINGDTVSTVLLDSVASQANRMELALQEAVDAGELQLPLVQVDFSHEPDLEEIGRISTLEAPHRLADAIFRDSVLNGLPFRATDAGRSLELASPRNATPLFQLCPHALIFGIWDSTGPKGGLGSKFQRVLCSEIVGIGAAAGKKTASRIDPLGIQANVDVYHAKESKKGWVLDPDQAARDKKGQPEKYGKEGNASAINHSNIPPSIDSKAGGVTVDHARQTAVLSLVGLRQLQFPVDTRGNRLEGAARRSGQIAARTLLAALGLVAVSLQRRSGFHLRSRALLVPTAPQVIELLDCDGGAPQEFALPPAAALDLFRQAATAAAEAGFGWNTEPLILHPAPKLAELVRRSRSLAAAAS